MQDARKGPQISLALRTLRYSPCSIDGSIYVGGQFIAYRMLITCYTPSIARVRGQIVCFVSSLVLLAVSNSRKCFRARDLERQHMYYSFLGPIVLCVFKGEMYVNAEVFRAERDRSPRTKPNLLPRLR